MSPDAIPKSRFGFAGAGVVLYLCLYFGVGLRETPYARSLATPLDALIPFWPSALWVYATVYPAVLAPLFIVRSPARFRRIALSLMAVIVLCAAAFVLWPVETGSLRRSAAVGPGPGADPSFTIWGYGLLFALDPPRNAFPSLHVALATVVALGVGRSLSIGGATAWRSLSIGGAMTWRSLSFGGATAWRLPGTRERRGAQRSTAALRARMGGTAWPAHLWLAAVAASVVLVRQHYVVDAVAGLALGALAHRVGVGGEGQPETPGDFERRGTTWTGLVVCAFYALIYAVYLTGWVPGG